MKIIQKNSPNFDERNGEEVTFLILHYTGMKTADEALERLCCKDAEVSSHYTVDEEGKVYQHVDEVNRAWHAGISSWQDQLNINSKSIGVEIVNPGHEFGYREFTDVQINSVKNISLEILKRHSNIEHVLAHSDIAPDRKQDPGELFPWKDLALNGIGIWPDVSDEDIIKGSLIQDIPQSLRRIGYEASKPKNMLIAFQRHYVPEVFEKGTEGVACSLTKGRLYALQAGHLLYPSRYSD